MHTGDLNDFMSIGTLSKTYKEYVIETAKEKNATHIMVVCDTFDYDDYPVYIQKGEDIEERVRHYNSQSMQKVMGVYALEAQAKTVENSIWIRAGISLKADKETLHKIASGDKEALRQVLDEGNWEFDGETYIPAISIEEYIKASGDTAIEPGEVEIIL